jgi:nicotinamidase/pyrazinamidase
VVDYDDRTALVVVDVQNDFADPEGNLYVSGGDVIIPRINDEVRKAVGSGSMVVYTQDWHPESTPHFETDGGIWPVHCVKHTWGAEFHPDLDVVGPVVQKGANGEDGYSGFTMRDPVSGEEIPTPLRAMLDERETARVVVIGLALDVCVKATALDANETYETHVILDACAPVELRPGDGARAIEELEANQVTIEG